MMIFKSTKIKTQNIKQKKENENYDTTEDIQKFYSRDDDHKQ